jgi:hypothetical protein
MVIGRTGTWTCMVGAGKASSVRPVFGAARVYVVMVIVSSLKQNNMSSRARRRMSELSCRFMKVMLCICTLCIHDNQNPLTQIAIPSQELRGKRLSGIRKVSRYLVQSNPN